MKSKTTKIVAAVSGMVLLAILVLPYIVNVDGLRPQLEYSLQSHLDREVHIGRLELSLLAGGARAENVSIADDPAFRSGSFLHAKSLDVGVSLFGLIFSRTLHVTSLTIEEPELVLAKSSSGKWNFSSLGSSEGSGEDGGTRSAPLSCFVLNRLKITNATLVLPGSRGSSQGNVLKNINVDLRNVSFDGKVSFSVSTHSDAGKIELRGEAGPINRENPERTPFHATLEGSKADLAQIVRLNSSAGLGGILALDASVTSDGRSLHSKGTARAEKLRLIASGAVSRHPVSLHYATDYSFARHSGSLDNCEISVRKSSTQLSGSYQVRGESLIAHFRLTGSQLSPDDLEGILPALGIQLPGSSKLHGGTVNANLAFDGPMDRVVTTGTAQVADAHLSGFDLGSKLSSIAALSGTNSSSELAIVALSSSFRIAPQGTHISNFNSQISGIGTLSGEGDIDANSNLNVKLVAHVAENGILRPRLHRVGLKRVPGDIPFQVRGTTAVPIFVPDLSGMVGTTATSAIEGATQRVWSEKPMPPAPRPSAAPQAHSAADGKTASSSSGKHGFVFKITPWRWKKQKGESE